MWETGTIMITIGYCKKIPNNSYKTNKAYAIGYIEHEDGTVQCYALVDNTRKWGKDEITYYNSKEHFEQYWVIGDTWYKKIWVSLVAVFTWWR